MRWVVYKGIMVPYSLDRVKLFFWITKSLLIFRAGPVSEQSQTGTSTLSSSVNPKMFNTFRLDPVSEQSKNPFRVSGASSRTGRSTSLSSAPTEARLRHRWVFLTYSQCSIESKDEFEKWFSYMLEQKDLKTATYYGCRENHETEGIHYHVLVNLGKQPNWGSEHARSVS